MCKYSPGNRAFQVAAAPRICPRFPMHSVPFRAFHVVNGRQIGRQVPMPSRVAKAAHRGIPPACRFRRARDRKSRAARRLCDRPGADKQAVIRHAGNLPSSEVLSCPASSRYPPTTPGGLRPSKGHRPPAQLPHWLAEVLISEADFGGQPCPRKFWRSRRLH